MPKEYEYHEGKQAQEDFEEGMNALFQVPISQNGENAMILKRSGVSVSEKVS